MSKSGVVSWIWESVGSHIRVSTIHYGHLLRFRPAGLFNIGLADGIPPDQMFAGWGPQLAVSISTFTSPSTAFWSPFLWVIHLLAVVNQHFLHHLLPGREFYVETW